MTTPRTLPSLVLLLPLLSGCSDSLTSSQCVKAKLISSLSRAPLHHVSKEDPRSMVISDFKSGCGGAVADLPGGEGDIGLSMVFTLPEVRQGQLNSGKNWEKEVVLPVFIALLDGDENVLDRKDENIHLTISNHALIRTHQLTYHLPEGVDSSSLEHHILVGVNGNIKPAHGN